MRCAQMHNNMKDKDRLKYYILMFVVLLAEWMCFTHTIGGMGNKFIVTLIKGAGDCALLLILYWILPKRYGWISLIVVWLVSVFFIVNAWYSRFWHEFVSPTSYRLWGNMNGDTLASVKALAIPADLIYFLAPVLITILYFNWKHKWIFSHNDKRIRIIIIVSSVCLFLVSQVGYAVTLAHWNRDLGVGEQSVAKNLRNNLFRIVDTCSIYDFQSKGLVIYYVTAIKNVVNDLIYSKEIRLIAEERESLKSFLHQVPQYPEVDEFMENSGKNVVIILVESLNSDVIGRKVNGHEITPFLNALIEKEGTVSALNILPQVKEGCSNDGQLLTNTGLLPLNQGVTSLTLGSHIVLPGLPKILKPKSSVAVFGDTGQTWNQSGAYESYGFRKIFTVKDYERKANEKGVDAAMFEYANLILDTIQQPFLMELVTFSMHVPFTHKKVGMQKWLENEQLAVNERNYLNMAHYTDTAIHTFYDNLARQGLLDSTIIFIISDHSSGLALDKNKVIGDADRQDLYPMAFIATNTGVTRRMDVPAGQVNVFPTILHIMGEGRSCYECYRGLDRSLLDSQLQSSVSTKGDIRGFASESEQVRQRRAYQVADSLQRGNYFADEY